MTPNVNTKFELRKDLVFSQYLIGFGKQTVVKDPLNLEYYFFGSFESGILKHLESPTTIQKLKQRFDADLAPGKIAEPEIQKFVLNLLRDNLLVTNELGVGNRIGEKKPGLGLLSFARFSGLLALRFRGFNPVNFFEWASPFTRIFFHPVFLVLAVLMYLAALCLLLVNVQDVLASGYIAQKLTQPDVIIPLGIAIVLVKILHEFGHGLACHSIGRKCHELGAMLLAFMPCLYCNVSDVWLEPNRWKRILVSVAGIYVELIIASICVPLWLFSLPGEFQFFCFSLFLVCSVNTIFVNGNPLLRYDGYFALSDYWQIPNLSDESQKSLASFWKRIFFFKDPDPAPITLQLCTYAIASSFYRKFILLAILFMVYSFFDNMGITNVGIFVCSLFLASSLLGGLIKMKASFSKAIGNIQSLRWIRTTVVLGVVGLVCYAIAIIPVSRKAYGTGKLVYANQGIVFASNSGKIEWIKQEGDLVKKGDLLARISNPDIEIGLLEATNELSAGQASLKNQELINRQGIDNLARIEMLRESCKNQQQVIKELKTQKSLLEIHSPTDGRLAPIPKPKYENPYQTDQIARTTCSLFPENRDSIVARGESLALIGHDTSARFEIMVPEKDIGKVKVGQRTVLNFEQASARYLYGTVEDIGIHRLDSNGGFDRNESTAETVKTSFLVTIKADKEQTFDTRYHAKTNAMIVGDSMPLYQSVWKYLKDNFE